MSAASAPFRNFRKLRNLGRFRSNDGGEDSFWALSDVSFEVKEGEVLGIVGRNGAGKSTLLKVLSRITAPTTGRVEICGRVGSLLEVGTGFHPELTGRENVFLNGSILGMDRPSITRRFEEIVEFSGVSRFIDTPVKRYSSGMYLRLAFSVAAHLEPEILIVDEVLAVGDAAFQKKCLGKMENVAKEGRTVLFVSHNTVAVAALCSRALMIADGRVAAIGDPEDITRQYLAATMETGAGEASLEGHTGRRGGSINLMRSVTLRTGDGRRSGSFPMDSTLRIEVDYESADGAIHPVLGLVVKTSTGGPVFGLNNRVACVDPPPPAMSAGRISWSFDRLPLMPGTYQVDLYLSDARLGQGKDLDVVLDAVSFEVLPADVFGSGKLPPPASGPVFWPGRLHIEPRSILQSDKEEHG